MTDRELMQQALETLEKTKPKISEGSLAVLSHDATITALRERLAQTEQEPVAWMYVNPDGECEQIEYEVPPNDPSVTPLYTAPRPWVGLTKEEAKEISMANRPYVVDMIAALEARLKEKNT